MPLPTSRIPIGSEKCVQGHRAVITDRGGGTPIMELKDISEISWGRATSAVSSATVVVTGASCRRQSAKFPRIKAKRHELVIYRGGLRVWEGPIRTRKIGRNRFTLTAHDVLAYVQGRPISKYWPGPDGGGPKSMTTRVQQILTYEMANSYVAPGTSPAATVPAWESISPAANVLPFLEVHSGDVQTTAEVLPFAMTVLEHIDDLARSGLDYTTVGRKIVVWDSAKALGQIRTLTEADIEGDPNLFSDGDELVTVQHVIGQADEDAPNTSTESVGSYVRDMGYYGPWAKIHTRSEEISETENVQVVLSTQARTLSAGKVPVPVELQIGSAASLRLDGSLTISDLVAGVDVPVVAKLMGVEIQQTQKLLSLDVSETANGESIKATIGQATTGG